MIFNFFTNEPTFVTDYWEIAGIEGLTTAGFYGPLGSW
jgi:hypothetical protein